MQRGLSPKRCAIIGMLILLPAAQLSAQVVRFVNAGAAPGGDGQS